MIDKETGEVLEDRDSDFGFYGEDAEETVVKDIKGVTDKVTEYVFSDMEFPCICLDADRKLPKHKWTVISKLVKQGTVEKDISFYMLRNGQLLKAGALSGIQIKAFIDVVGIENLFGYQNSDKLLKGDKLYALASFM